jgi:hypothetical protein
MLLRNFRQRIHALGLIGRDSPEDEMDVLAGLVFSWAYAGDGDEVISERLRIWWRREFDQEIPAKALSGISDEVSDLRREF